MTYLMGEKDSVKYDFKNNTNIKSIINVSIIVFSLILLITLFIPIKTSEYVYPINPGQAAPVHRTYYISAFSSIFKENCVVSIFFLASFILNILVAIFYLIGSKRLNLKKYKTLLNILFFLCIILLLTNFYFTFVIMGHRISQSSIDY